MTTANIRVIEYVESCKDENVYFALECAFDRADFERNTRSEDINESDARCIVCALREVAEEIHIPASSHKLLKILLN